MLVEQRIDDAATAYARYVLDVRDGFELCNGQIRALRAYSEAMDAALSTAD